MTASLLGLALWLLLPSLACAAAAAPEHPFAALQKHLRDRNVQAMVVDSGKRIVTVTPLLGKRYLVTYGDETQLADLIPMIGAQQGVVAVKWRTPDETDRVALRDLSTALEGGFVSKLTIDSKDMVVRLTSYSGSTTTVHYGDEAAVSMLIASQGLGVDVAWASTDPPRPW